MSNEIEFPSEFLAAKARMTQRYLAHEDPRLQSGFGGGAERWREERRPILDPIDRDGSLVDLGCANGYLLECLVSWARERGIRLVPYGVDQCEELIQLACERLSEFASHFLAANVWSWLPPRRFTYVYTLADVVPETHLQSYLRRLLARAVEPDGLLIVGSYGSHSRSLPPTDLESILPTYGLDVAGSTRAGPGDIVSVAWVAGVGQGSGSAR
jgi:hypothetical protein